MSRKERFCLICLDLISFVFLTIFSIVENRTIYIPEIISCCIVYVIICVTLEIVFYIVKKKEPSVDYSDKQFILILVLSGIFLFYLFIFFGFPLFKGV